MVIRSIVSRIGTSLVLTSSLIDRQPFSPCTGYVPEECDSECSTAKLQFDLHHDLLRLEQK